MKEYDIIGRMEEVLSKLKGKRNTEVYEYLDDFIADNLFTTDDDLFEIANDLLECDEPKPFPKVVRDFIEELYTVAFENGNPDAMNAIGALYYEGARGFDQDFTKAVNCYKIAAENGSRQAQENLGYCYYYGRNMPVDYEKAFHYFALGAFDGHLISLYKIGDMYKNGYYVEKNLKEAFLIYSRCLDTMTDETAPYAAGPVFLRLGNAHLYGEGTEKDPKRALFCFQKAELFLYDMIQNGSYMYKKSLEAAVEGQQKAREEMGKELPGREWTFDD